MGKKGLSMPEFTGPKLLRMAIFIAVTAAGFLLARNVPDMSSFGWGYTFGLVGMAILIG